MNLLENVQLKPHFSGHETFPLRHAWIPKALPLLAEDSTILCNSEELMLRMGVGKNMAKSVRHWLETTRLVELEGNSSHSISEIGSIVFSEHADPFLESTDTIWLLHFLMATNPQKSSLWYYLFNLYAKHTFTKNRLNESVLIWCDSEGLQAPSQTTLNRDVTALLATYSAAVLKREKDLQAVLSCPLKELHLFTHRTDDGDHIWKFRQLTFGEISEDLFAYCLLRFLEVNNWPSTVSFSDILESPGSPARVFHFSENLLAKYLHGFGLQNEYSYRFSTTAGSKQLLRPREVESSSIDVLKKIYSHA
jgi:hypothetical protein